MRDVCGNRRKYREVRKKSLGCFLEKITKFLPAAKRRAVNFFQQPVKVPVGRVLNMLKAAIVGLISCMGPVYKMSR